MTFAWVVAVAGTLSLAGCGDRKPTALAADRGQAPQSARVTDEVSLLGFRIEIVDSDPCVARVARDGTPQAELRLGLSPPCALHRNADATVRVHPVKDRQVILVERSTPDGTRKSDCDTRVQALIVLPDGVRSSAAVEHVAICTPFRWDDVMFIALSESAAKP